MLQSQPSPASIPLPVSLPLSPRNAEQPRTSNLIDLFPDESDAQNGFANKLKEGLSVHLGQLRSIVDDVGSSRGSLVDEDIEGDGDEADDGTAQYEDAAPEVTPTVARTTSSGMDSLYKAIRSPSPETAYVTAQANQQEGMLYSEGPQSSGELTRMMARFPIMVAGPSSEYTRPQPQPREPLLPEQPNGSYPRSVRSQPSSGARSTGEMNAGSSRSQVPVVSGSSRPEHEWMSNPRVPLFGPGSLTSPLPPDEVDSAPPIPDGIYPQRSPPENQSTLPRPLSPVSQLQASMERNRRESEALARDLATTRQEAALLEEKCEELKDMLTSLNLMPPPDGRYNGMARNFDVPRGSSSRPASTNANPEMRTTGALGLKTGTTPEMVTQNIPVHDSARDTLAHVSRKLSIPMSALTDRPIPSPPASLPPESNGLDPTSLDDVKRALDFVRTVDTLVWKGRRRGGDNRRSRGSEALFGEENIQALKDRVELWEKIVRSKR